MIRFLPTTRHFSSLLLLGLLACSKDPSPKPTPPVPPVTPPTAVTTFTNPLLAVAPDPWVYQKDGYYYFTSTTGGDITLRKTAKMSALGTAVSTVAWRPQQAGVNQRDLWAPELYFFDGKWYIYYSADPFCCAGHRVHVLENSAADPTTGTWEYKGRIANPTEDFWAIDGTVLEQNGKRYLIWSGHSMDSDPTQRLYISEMSNPWTLVGPRVELSHPQYNWELNGDPKVNEGPEIVQHGGKTNLVYSASHCSTDDYTLGLLSCSITADPMVPASWTKKQTPVFVKNAANHAYGPGHNGFFKSKDGTQDWIIYHANSNPGEGCGDRRNPRMQPFTWNTDDTPNFGDPVNISTPITKPSGE
jgi:GH43 family beta-xylosidase